MSGSLELTERKLTMKGKRATEESTVALSHISAAIPIVAAQLQLQRDTGLMDAQHRLISTLTDRLAKPEATMAAAERAGRAEATLEFVTRERDELRAEVVKLRAASGGALGAIAEVAGKVVGAVMLASIERDAVAIVRHLHSSGGTDAVMQFCMAASNEAHALMTSEVT